jgi:hypothetical protein
MINERESKNIARNAQNLGKSELKARTMNSQHFSNASLIF